MSIAVGGALGASNAKSDQTEAAPAASNGNVDEAGATDAE
jgi:hypothetical protein